MKVKAQISMHPSMQFLILIGIFVGTVIIGSVLGLGISIALYGQAVMPQIQALNFANQDVVTAMWIIQIAGLTLPLAISPTIFARYVVNDTGEYLKTNTGVPASLFVLALGIMLVSSPFMEVLIGLNQKMQLPDALKELQQWMRDREDIAQKQVEAMLQMKTVGGMLLAVLEIGLLTAIAEELMFRGPIQTIFTRWTKNPHWGIWITAIIFSAFHMEFFGFVPRIILGAMFGYFVFYSGSIWPAIWGHFVNNGSVVVLTYLYQQKIVNFNPDSEHYNYIVATLSLIFTVFLFFIYQRVALSKKQLQVYNGERLG